MDPIILWVVQNTIVLILVTRFLGMAGFMGGLAGALVTLPLFL